LELVDDMMHRLLMIYTDSIQYNLISNAAYAIYL